MKYQITKDKNGVPKWLTPQERQFLHEYLANGMKSRAAALAVFPDLSPTQASNLASRWLKNKRIRHAIQRHVTKYDVKAEKIIQELAYIAFLDPAELFDEEGKLKKIDEIPPATRRALAGFDAQITKYQDTIIKVKLRDKLEALKLLGKLMNMFVEKHEINVTGTLVEELQRGRDRLARLTGRN